MEDPQDPPDPQDAEAPEELSELQRLTQELTSLNTSLARLEAAQPVEVSAVEAVEAPVEAPAAEPSAPGAPGREMATLLTTLEDLNRSLGQLEPSQQQNVEKMAGEAEIQQMMQMQMPKTGSPSGQSHHCARQPQAAEATEAKAHHLEQVFPQQAPRVPPAAHPAPGAIGANLAIGAIDPGGDVGRCWDVYSPYIWALSMLYSH